MKLLFFFQQNGVKVLPCKIQQKSEREKNLMDFAKNVSIDRLFHYYYLL